MTVEEQLTLEDELEDFAADFVSDKHSDTHLRRLFQRESGKWITAQQLCNEQEDVLARLGTLQESAEGTLQVAWLENPESAYGEGYVTILFFVESVFWKTLAIYNKARLCGEGAAE